ncbi:MAG: DUF418 domain-containing protein [Bryobacteraceae bacterium]|nr:DUF418 domain-containing protein [Bryobacteraceae bacterium]
METPSPLQTPVVAESVTAPPAGPFSPVSAGERISSIDTLRGFALLGILLMNIVGFGLHFAAYDDPTVAGGATGINLATWTALHILAEGKMRCLFSLVFGASAILLTSRLDSRPDGADIYYRRMLWLLAFGMAHGYLLWHGEILFPYAMCGLILYPFRKLSVRWLLGIASVLIVLQVAAVAFKGHETREIATQGPELVKKEAAGAKLTDSERETKEKWETMRRMMRPTPEELQKDAQQWRGSVIEVIKARAKIVLMFNSKPLYMPIWWDLFSMMFLGMGLMKVRLFDATAWPAKTFVLLAVIGYGIGIPVNSWSAWLVIKSNFDLATHWFANMTYDVGRLSIAMGHLGVLMLLCRQEWLAWITSRLAAAGQMAFSNYVMHSLICAFLFTGYGFKLYGQLERYQLYYVVGAIWLVQFAGSIYWLRRHRFGPLEWCWRSLTYWKKQPMSLDAQPSSFK